MALFLALLLCVAIISGAINAAILRIGKSAVCTEFASGEAYDCILVLGAGLRSDGSPSDMLSDRLKRAVELYQRGVSDTLVLSGDRSGDSYDEVSAMAEFCVERGIPETAIVRDFFGYSTYESVHNTLAMGYDRFVVVTQEYHLYRALYIARGMDAEAVGFAADYRTYRGQVFREIREAVARVKDFWFVIFS